MTITLVLGGTRSGKSAFAQTRAETTASRSDRRPLMIVTAQAFDTEMQERISRHRADRGEGWDTLEAPRDLAAAIGSLRSGEVAVVDCLTLWLSNLMAVEADVEGEFDALAAAVTNCGASLWLVSNEVGWGIVPDNALARRFRDHAGRLHQRLAAAADEVVLVVAGLPLVLKSSQAGAIPSPRVRS